MKASVDSDGCISCGLCVSTCPEVFAFNEDEKSYAKVDTIPEENIASAIEARDGCPVSVIDIDEG